MRKILALVTAFAMLFVSLQSPVAALQMQDLTEARDEAALREAVKGDELWVQQYPNGLFNFVGTQYVVNESQKFLEIAIARQGGTAGEASVDFKAIDVSAEYGKDYIIRVYENSDKMKLKKNENTIPLIQTMTDNPEINISTPSAVQVPGEEDTYGNDGQGPEMPAVTPGALNMVPEAASEMPPATPGAPEAAPEALPAAEGTPDILPETPPVIEKVPDIAPGTPSATPGALEAAPEAPSTTEGAVNRPSLEAPQEELQGEDSQNQEQSLSELSPQAITIGGGTGAKSLRGLREAALGKKSDRPDWKYVDLQTIEKLKSEYDKFFYNVQGAETTIHFKDGEYIKYLYIVPLNDDIPESEEQVLFALTNPTGQAVRGEFYMAYANIKDDEAQENAGFEIDSNSVSVNNGKASVVVRRTAGIQQYSSVYIGTEEISAIPELDYVPGLQELFFVPGMSEQTVTVDILNNSARTAPRVFRMALDRKNDQVNAEKSEAEVVIPAQMSVRSLLPADAGAAGIPGNLLRLASAAASVGATAPAAMNNEKISPYGYSTAKGLWSLMPQDFVTGYVAGKYSVDPQYNSLLKLEANGTQSYAYAANTKLYGVESLYYEMNNTGCGHHWTTVTKDYPSDWSRFWNVNAFDVYTNYEEHNFYTAFTVQSPAITAYKDTLWGNRGWEGHRSNIEENLWNTSWVGFYTWAAGGNQSTATISSPGLTLKRYNLNIANNQVPKFQTKKYRVSGGNLTESATLIDEKPGTMFVKAVYSIVNNGQPSVNGYNAEVFRSDKIEFRVEYADNEIGRNSQYTGFEVKTADGWRQYPGTVLSLDTAFFSQNGILSEIRDGVIDVRPVFEQKKADIKFQADTVNGYIPGIGERVAEKKFDGLHAGDVAGASALNYLSSVTPSWSSNNIANITSTDSTGANTSVDYKLSPGSNYLSVVFGNPTLIVQANPNVYLYNVSEPEYKINGTSYTIENLHQKIKEIYAAGSDATISLSFKYVFNSSFPDPGNANRDAFGTPQEAVLTVYKSDGTVRGIYNSPRNSSSPNNYTAAVQNGTFTYTGKLKELGWEDGDYATVIIYGSKNIAARRASTRENLIDFLTNSGAGVTVKKPDGNIVAGNVYKPITINNADPIANYEMAAYLAPGFVAKWADYSGDLNGDGQVSYDEYIGLKAKMNSYGMDLEKIYTNPAYKELFWGNFFNYVPKFFNPSKVLYNFEKAATGSTSWIATAIIKEKYRTVIDPDTPSEAKPIAGATVIVGNKSYITDEKGRVAISDPIFQERNYYLARVIHKGYEFYTYVQPGCTIEHTFDTSDVMRPTNFTASFRADSFSSPESIPLDKNNTLVPVKNGVTEFNFRVDRGKEGISANNACIRIYKTNKEGDRTEKVYEKMVGEPTGGVFTHSMNLLAEQIQPGCRMTISPLYIRDGAIAREYPEVDAGLTFSMNLTVISALASFDTPFSPALEFIGQLDNSFDLGMDVEIDDIAQKGTRVDKNGVSHNTKYLSFGFNKDFEKKFGDQKDEEDEDDSVLGKLKKAFEDSDGAADKDKTKDLVKDSGGSDKKDAGSGGGSFNFDFSVSLTIAIEEGEVTKNGISVKDGFHYFSSIVLMASGNAAFNAKCTYVTPIGIPVFASIDISGNASAILGIEANDSERYVDKYKFDSHGKVSLNPTDYSIYTKFYVNPTITISAGVGMDYLNVYLEGSAVFDFNFTVPIIGENEVSQGSGGLVMSAAVGITILFIEKKWTLYQSKRIDLFNYSDAPRAMMASLSNPYSSYLYEPVPVVGEEDILSRDYLGNSSEWLGDSGFNEKTRLFAANQTAAAGGNNETVLKRGVYPYPQTKLVQFGDGRLLALFIDDAGTRDDLNRAQLFYTIYDGAVWSDPIAVDGDETWDEAPDAFMVGDKILVTWADAGRKFSMGEEAQDLLSAMNISVRWFDTNTASFDGPEAALTRDTSIDTFADINPRISYDDAAKRLMVYYTKIDYNDSWDYNSTPQNDPSAERAETDDGESSAVYGDIVNGYNVIAYRYAQQQPDGSFAWNTSYADEEGMDPDQGFTPEGFYGQRFLNLSVLVDINEREIRKAPHDTTVDETTPPAILAKDVIGTEQTVTPAANANTDPLVTESDLATYNGLALYSYVMDSDSSKSTTGDQELYLQLYNYETNEFHHPIRLTNNSVQDAKPHFVRTKGITYLYWLSGGNIVYMDISDLIRNHLKKETVPVGNENRAIYIVDKSDTGINGYVKTAVERRTDDPIEDFQIQSNGESEYLLWTDYAITYKNGLKAGDPGTEKPENINREKQIFAAYCVPQKENVPKQVNDFYVNTDSIEYVYAGGQGPGNYPYAVRALKDITENGNTIPEGTTGVIDYTTVNDVNGFKGVVKAGDPVMKQQFEDSGGYDWSVPVQLTHEAGANYRDISFAVDGEGNIRAVYVKYGQVLNEENTFVEDTGSRVFASGMFRAGSAVEAEDIKLSEELPAAGRALDFSVNLRNNGVKPLTDLKYASYIKKAGEELPHGPDLQFITDTKGDRLLIGGGSAVLNGSFELPEDLSDISVGFRITDGDGNVLLEKERTVPTAARLNIAVLGSMLKDEATAGMSLYISNSGNIKYAGKLDVAANAEDRKLKELDLELNAGESRSLDLEFGIEASMYGDVKTAEDGSAFDSIELVLTAGDCTKSAEIKRTAGKSLVDSFNNVKAFSVNSGNIAIGEGKTYKLNAETDLYTPIPEYTADPLQVKWKTSNPDVASVLPDGTVVGLSKGSAVITASLVPADTEIETLDDGSIRNMDTSYKLPDGIIRQKTVSVTVGNTGTGSSNNGGQEENGKSEVKQQTGEVVVEVKPEINGRTSTIKLDTATVQKALEQAEKESKANLVLASSSDSQPEISRFVMTGDIMERIGDSKISTLSCKTPLNKITLDKEAVGLLKKLAGEAGGKQEIAISISGKNPGSYPEDLKKLVGSRPVYDFSIMVGGQNIRDITSSPIDLTLELGGMLAPGGSDNPDQIVGAYITEDGEYTIIPLSMLKDGKLIIKTSHNSVYGGLYKPLKFKDVSGWSENYINFLTARGVISGKGKETFAPKSNITRAEFIRMLAIVSDADTDKYEKPAFADIREKDWYASSVGWAYAEGLVSGAGNNLFAPDRNVTREEMAVIISKFAKKLGYVLPEVNKAKVFKDAASITGYAGEAVAAVQRAGIMDGRPNGLFAPKSGATREETTVVITKLIKRIVDK